MLAGSFDYGYSEYSTLHPAASRERCHRAVPSLLLRAWPRATAITASRTRRISSVKSAGAAVQRSAGERTVTVSTHGGTVSTHGGTVSTHGGVRDADGRARPCSAARVSAAAVEMGGPGPHGGGE